MLGKRQMPSSSEEESSNIEQEDLYIMQARKYSDRIHFSLYGSLIERVRRNNPSSFAPAADLPNETSPEPGQDP